MLGVLLSQYSEDGDSGHPVAMLSNILQLAGLRYESVG